MSGRFYSFILRAFYHLMYTKDRVIAIVDFWSPDRQRSYNGRHNVRSFLLYRFSVNRGRHWDRKRR